MSATSTSQHSKSAEVKTKPRGPREGSVMWAVIQVLDGKRKAMTPAEILAEITDRNLAKKLAGKTPEASVAARLAVSTYSRMASPPSRSPATAGARSRPRARAGRPAARRAADSSPRPEAEDRARS